MRGRLVRGAVLGVALLGAGGIAWAATGGSNVVGPRTRIQPTGRQLNPVGKLTKLGNFPTGGALTPDGRFLWTLSTGRGINDIRIVAVTGRHAGRVVQRIRMPGLSGGIAISRTAAARMSRASPTPPSRTRALRAASRADRAT